MTNVQLAEELCRKFPEAPSLTLAKRLYKENVAAFSTLEAARTVIRSVRGVNGKLQKARAARDPKLFKDASEPVYNPFGLPEPVDISYPPFKAQGSRFLVIGDLHVPYHDIQAITLALEHGKHAGVDAILINGDLIDFHRISDFVKEVKSRTPKEELATAYEVLSIIRNAFPKAKIYYKFGNHDERFDRYIRVKAPELMDLHSMPLSEQQWVKGRTLNDLKVTVIQHKLRVYIGKLPVLHGHEWRKGFAKPVNPARGAYLKAKDCVLVGDCHQESTHTVRTVNDKMITCWSVGCLCQLHPFYDPNNDWSQGFALVTRDKSGSFNVRNHRIYQGKVW